MKKVFFILLTLSLFAPFLGQTTPSSRAAIYKSLDPHSLAQLLAFYELYPTSPEGTEALRRAWKLLDPKEEIARETVLDFPFIEIEPMIALVNRHPYDRLPEIQDKELQLLQKIASSLANRQLPTYGSWEEKDFLHAKGEEIDLARGLLLALWGSKEEAHQKILSYEALLDLMALQIKANLPSNATPYDKIHAINDFIFFELGFRFPPHAIYAKNIDTYTFLPSVMDNRKGVCLGVSILYLCLAQRLDLALEIITPPGHIYVRYNDDQQLTNIETTARGIDIPSEQYLSIETKKLQRRSLKETIGLAFANQASVTWIHQDHQEAISLYKKALLYLDQDPLVEEFLAYNLLCVGRKKEAETLLKKIALMPSSYATEKNTIIEDFLEGKIDSSGIETIFLPVDETRLSILEKQTHLLTVLKHHPHFRAGHLQLATCYLQLGREKEATIVLKHYQAIDAQSPLVNYYLSALSLSRHDYNAAWKYYGLADLLLCQQQHHPKALKDLQMSLMQIAPAPD